jgi:hypothetical protein
MTSLTPKESLLAGVEILKPTLAPLGFVFEFRTEGRGSGGGFAWGEFVRGDRRLELHYRGNLGLVAYHAADKTVTHEAYMRELGVWGRNHYPGFSDEYLQAFRDLAHDLGFAQDFTSGTASVLLAAASKEASTDAALSESLRAGYVGDTRDIEKLHDLFREKRYAEVVAIFNKLQFPHLLSDAQLRLVQLARERTNG